jgi:hypothetical protein
VLGAVVMHLQGQGFTRLDGETLDLVPLAMVDGLEITPGAVRTLMVSQFPPLGALEVLGDGLDILGVLLADHQHRIRGLDHHQAIDPDDGHHPMPGHQQLLWALWTKASPSRTLPSSSRSPHLPEGRTKRRHRTSPRPGPAPRAEAPGAAFSSDKCSMTA